ncbi:MAG: extracellular solute-binding protein, partial [Myxococcota bacterium]|nr:extracellular solute-binding protein [Myxococcota bacterium]
MTRLSFALLAALLFAPEVAEAKSLVLWHSYRGAEEKALDEVLERYQAAHPSAPGIEALALPYDVLSSKLTTAIPRGHGPDLFIFAHERAGGWADAGMIESLTKAVEPAERDEFFETTIRALEYDGQLYGLPLAFKSLVLFYNRRLIPEPPRNTDELIALGETLVSEGKYGLAYQASQFYFHAPWYFGFGGRLDVGADELGLGSAGAIDSYDFVKRLYAKGIMPQEQTGALVTQLFNEERVGMVINGPWFLGEMDEGLDFGVSPLPMVSATGRAATPFLSDEAVFVSARSGQKECATELARYLAGEESAVIRARVGRQVVAHRDAWRKAGLEEDTVLSVFKDQVNAVVPMSNDPRMRDVWEPGDLALKKLSRGGVSGKQAGVAAERRHAAITQAPPEPVNATGFVVVLVALCAVALAGVLRWVASVVRSGQLEALSRGAKWVGPGLSVIAVLVFVPFIVSLFLSFFSHRAGVWEFVGFGNFVSILSAQSFGMLEPLSFYYALLITVAWTGLN